MDDDGTWEREEGREERKGKERKGKEGQRVQEGERRRVDRENEEVKAVISSRMKLSIVREDAAPQTRVQIGAASSTRGRERERRDS